MKKYIFSVLVILAIVSSAPAQSLHSFSADMSAEGKSCISIENKKAYSAREAVAVKNSIDLAFIITREGNNTVLEWYNLDVKHGKVPAELAGTKTGINAISFDREQFNKCKTAADLRRMTGHLTKNSFSHFAVIRGNSPQCFIVETASGKRALLLVTSHDNNTLSVEVKSE